MDPDQSEDQAEDSEDYELTEDEIAEAEALARFHEMCELAQGLYVRAVGDEEGQFVVDKHAHFREKADTCIAAAYAFFCALDEFDYDGES